MRMVFYAADVQELERLGRELEGAGIACEVRKEAVAEGTHVRLPEPELWVQNDGDSHRAWLLCVAWHSGFARREHRGFGFDGLSEDLAA